MSLREQTIARHLESARLNLVHAANHLNRIGYSPIAREADALIRKVIRQQQSMTMTEANCLILPEGEQGRRHSRNSSGVCFDCGEKYDRT